MLMSKITLDFKEIELGMSNCFGTVDEGFEEALKLGNVFGTHYAWHFVGYVYFINNKFYEDIYTYGTYNETLEGNSLEEIKNKANLKYGTA